MKHLFLAYDELDALGNQHAELLIENSINLAIGELFDIAYPAKKDNKSDTEVAEFAKQLTQGDPERWGQWIYYPWLNKVVHFPPIKEFRDLRTSRNRNLISSQEQAKLYETTILIIGMSVGSNVVEALISQGLGGKFVLVDMDIIEPSNLNRIRSPYHHVGLHKVEAISRKIWEVDPYLEVIDYRDGLNEQNIRSIITTNRVDIIVDEMDELRMKVLLREEAKANKLPVVMAADDGDDALIDIERYDLDNTTEIFNGRIPEPILNRLKSEKIPRAELGIMIGKYFVGSENIPLRMFQSLMEVGKTLPSWPQLGGAAALSGVILAYIMRKIILKENIKDGRILVSIDEKLDLERLNEDHQKQLVAFQKRIDGLDNE